MPTILNYYEFAKLATAAYVVMDSYTTFNGADFVREANRDDAMRIPIGLAEQMFVADPVHNPNVWEIPTGGYHGNDPTGFAATLFERTEGGVTEKVLAIRGTEPTGDKLDPTSQFRLDLVDADIGQIGLVGFALEQTISMINYILQLKGNAGASDVTQFKLHVDEYVPLSRPHVVLDPSLGPKRYAWIEITNDGQGLGLINAGDRVTLTGHSLGGHLAALAARLFPENFGDVYAYNAPGFDPSTALWLQLGYPVPFGFTATAGPLQLTEQFMGLFANWLSPASSFSALRLRNLESENLAPGNDGSLVASVFTGATALGPETLVSTERNSHLIEPLMDSLGMHSQGQSGRGRIAVQQVLAKIVRKPTSAPIWARTCCRPIRQASAYSAWP